MYCHFYFVCFSPLLSEVFFQKSTITPLGVPISSLWRSPRGFSVRLPRGVSPRSCLLVSPRGCTHWGYFLRLPQGNPPPKLPSGPAPRPTRGFPRQGFGGGGGGEGGGVSLREGVGVSHRGCPLGLPRALPGVFSGRGLVGGGDPTEAALWACPAPYPGFPRAGVWWGVEAGGGGV